MRPRSISPGRDRMVRSTSGMTGARSRAVIAGSPKLTSDSRPVEVEISATPITRGPNSSGCRSTSDITAMPPIEWPTSTTGPVGATSASTR